MTSLSTLRSATKPDYNTLVNFQSAVKAMIEGKRVHFLGWKAVNAKDRLATKLLGGTTIYVRQHINAKGRLTSHTMVSEHEQQTADWIIES